MKHIFANLLVYFSLCKILPFHFSLSNILPFHFSLSNILPFHFSLGKILPFYFSPSNLNTNKPNRYHFFYSTSLHHTTNILPTIASVLSQPGSHPIYFSPIALPYPFLNNFTKDLIKMSPLPVGQNIQARYTQPYESLRKVLFCSQCRAVVVAFFFKPFTAMYLPHLTLIDISGCGVARYS